MEEILNSTIDSLYEELQTQLYAEFSIPEIEEAISDVTGITREELIRDLKAGIEKGYSAEYQLQLITQAIQDVAKENQDE